MSSENVYPSVDWWLIGQIKWLHVVLESSASYCNIAQVSEIVLQRVKDENNVTKKPEPEQGLRTSDSSAFVDY